MAFDAGTVNCVLVIPGGERLVLQGTVERVR